MPGAYRVEDAVDKGNAEQLPHRGSVLLGCPDEARQRAVERGLFGKDPPRESGCGDVGRGMRRAERRARGLRNTGGAGDEDRRQRGQGREFESLREYREGDELRDISWTATARRHHLVTRVFQIERSQAVWLVLDAGRLLRAKVAEPGRIPISKLDYAANAALSLAQIAMHCGDRVGLLAYGRNIQQNLNAGRGPHQMRAIVEALAHIRGEAGEADHGRAVHTLLSEQKRRSLIVWITDFAETATTPEVLEFAMHMANRHLIVFAAMGQPDLNALAAATPETTGDMYRHVAALEIADRRSALLGALRQRGVLVLELMPGMLASSLVNQYMDVKERGLL